MEDDFDAFQPDSGKVTELWRAKLLKDGNRAVLPLLANAITAFEHSPAWAGVLAFDSFSQRTRLRRPAPWMRQDADADGEEWSADHDVRAANWMQHQEIRVGTDVVSQAVETVARVHAYHPVLDYLAPLVHDGTARIDTWLTTYLGVEDTPFARAVGRRWLVSAVARVHQPGCKADCALILEGPQGLLKSTALKVLGAPFFTDEVEDLGTKDSAMQIAGVWIIELAELDSLRRSEVTHIKAFLARTTDRFRPPYGRRVIELPRQCVMAGTTNRDTYLQDETGGRRFWPVRCTAIAIDDLREDRDQLWAEALALYRNGEQWWLTDAEQDLARAQQGARLEQDPWLAPIGEFITARSFVTMGELLKDCLKVTLDKQDGRAASRAAACLTVLGWVRRQRRVDGRPRWMYVPDRSDLAQQDVAVTTVTTPENPGGDSNPPPDSTA